MLSLFYTFVDTKNFAAAPKLIPIIFHLKNVLFPTPNFNFFLKNKILAFAGVRNSVDWEGKVEHGAIKCALEKRIERERVQKNSASADQPGSKTFENFTNCTKIYPISAANFLKSFSKGIRFS